MTVYEKIKSMNDAEFADFIARNGDIALLMIASNFYCTEKCPRRYDGKCFSSCEYPGANYDIIGAWMNSEYSPEVIEC